LHRSTTREYLLNLQTQKNNLSVVLVDHHLMQSEARNLAMRHVDERFCVVLENDTIVHENWLSPCSNACETTLQLSRLIWWYRGIHAAGCMFDEREEGPEGCVQS
jgi:hypothetical protein